MVMPLNLLICTENVGSTNRRGKQPRVGTFVLNVKTGQQCERLEDLKENNPVEVAEYAVSKSLLDDPDFVWWAPHVLKKRSRIIAPVTKRYHKRTHKFGIEVPKSWDDCVRLGKENDNTLLQDAVRK
jgi:hypothetical protein